MQPRLTPYPDEQYDDVNRGAGPSVSKRLERMRANPHGDWRIEDIHAVCREFGIRCEAPRGGSSHFEVIHPTMRDILTIPFKRPISRYIFAGSSSSSKR
jgi:hypothetical protein